MRIVIASDAWKPQVNGVVTTLGHTRDELRRMGSEVLMVTPEGHRTVPCPTYPEIRLAIAPARQIRRELDAFRADRIHIATEGPIGWAVRRYCLARGLDFTTAWHTQFPEYLRARAPLPVAWSAAALRWFHAPAVRTMVPTPSVQRLLESRRFLHLVVWTRGVDTALFRPDSPEHYALPRPIHVYMGRVAVEKNIEAFLSLDVPGSKVVIGDGPDRERLAQGFPDCHFIGYRFGDRLARALAGGDVFVFPSKTDTFGLVMLEAMACGLPVAAYPVAGPRDVVLDGRTGALDDDLARACARALTLDRNDCRRYALDCSWASSARQFASYLTPARPAQAGVSAATET